MGTAECSILSGSTLFGEIKTMFGDSPGGASLVEILNIMRKSRLNVTHSNNSDNQFSERWGCQENQPQL